jgi:hypothetical protein
MQATAKGFKIVLESQEPSAIDTAKNLFEFSKTWKQEGFWYAMTGEHFKEWITEVSLNTFHAIINFSDVLIIVALIFGIGTIAGSKRCGKYTYWTVILYVVLKLCGGVF